MVDHFERPSQSWMYPLINNQLDISHLGFQEVRTSHERRNLKYHIEKC